MYKERPYFFQQKNARVDEDFYNYNKKAQKNKTKSESVAFRKTMFALLLVSTLLVSVFLIYSPVPGLIKIAPGIEKMFIALHLDMGVLFSIIFPFFSLILGLTVVSLCKSTAGKVLVSLLTVLFAVDAFYLAINLHMGLPGLPNNVTSPFFQGLFNSKLFASANGSMKKLLYFEGVANANKILPQLLNVYLGCLFVFFLVAAIRKPRVDSSLLAFTLFVFMLAMLPFAFKAFNNFASKANLKALTKSLVFMQTYVAWYYLGVCVLLISTSIAGLVYTEKKPVKKEVAK